MQLGPKLVGGRHDGVLGDDRKVNGLRCILQGGAGEDFRDVGVVEIQRVVVPLALELFESGSLWILIHPEGLLHARG